MLGRHSRGTGCQCWEKRAAYIANSATYAPPAGSPAYSFTYLYDRYGNGTCVGGSGGGVCPALSYNSNTNQLTYIGSAPVSYDAAGNQLNDIWSTYQYDAEGRVTHSSSSGQWQYPTYNALGQRVQDYQSAGSSDSMKLSYPRDIFGQRTGIWDDHSSVNWVGWDVYWSHVAGQRLNMGGSSAYIDHADAIGSTTMETDPAGGVQWDMTHYPWGQVWQQGGTRQSGVYANLDWQVNDPLQPSATREYSPVLGRWMTPDPLGQAAANPANPQSWNLYAYVMNNPTTFADPLGLLGPNDCNPNATCITVNGGAPPQISPIVELLMDENINIPNSQLPPQLPPLNHGPLSIAPNNGQLSKQTQCAEQALKKNGVALGLDAAGIGAGFLPGGDRVIASAQATVSVASGINNAVHGDPVGGALGVLGLPAAFSGAAAKFFGVGAKAIPGIGTAISAFGGLNDLYITYQDYESCMRGQ